MKNFKVREKGNEAWSVVTGFDIYEAAEIYAEELDDEGRITSGDQVTIEVMVDKDTIRSVLVYAELQVKYYSRDAN